MSKVREVKRDIRRLETIIDIFEMVEEFPFKNLQDYKNFMGKDSILVSGHNDLGISIDPLALLQMMLIDKRHELKMLSEK